MWPAAGPILPPSLRAMTDHSVLLTLSLIPLIKLMPGSFRPTAGERANLICQTCTSYLPREPFANYISAVTQICETHPPNICQASAKLYEAFAKKERAIC